MLSNSWGLRSHRNRIREVLAERGHEIHFITSSMPFRLNRMVPNIFFHQVEVNSYSVFQYAPYDIALASKMAEVSKKRI